jgi:hypothetical protein
MIELFLINHIDLSHGRALLIEYAPGKYRYPDYDGFGPLDTFELGFNAFLTEDECKEKWYELKYEKVSKILELEFKV